MTRHKPAIYLLPTISICCFLGASLPCFAQSSAFEQVPGSLSQISVGADGAVWGLDSHQNIFTYDSGSGQFVQVPGALTQIAVGNANAVWGINAQQLIFRWDSTNQSWTYIPGSLKQIAVGADGDVWGLNANLQVWHYNQQAQTWDYITGTSFNVFGQLTVGNDGSVYALDETGIGYYDPYWYNPGNRQFQEVTGTNFPGSLFAIGQIVVGADGDLWGVGNIGPFHRSPTAGWQSTNGSTITQIAVGSGANVWGLASPTGSTPVNGAIYQWNAQSATWVSVPGQLAQIAAGADGSVWGLDSSNRVYHYTGPAQPYHTLTQLPGSFSQISVAPDGTAWAVDATNLVYVFDRGTQSFQNVPGQSMTRISVGSAAVVWGINSGGGVWQWEEVTPNWSPVGGELNQIAVNANPSIFGINLYGQTYMYLEGWVNIPGTLAQLSLGADGTVWGINAQEQIYSYDSNTA